MTHNEWNENTISNIWNYASKKTPNKEKFKYFFDKVFIQLTTNEKFIEKTKKCLLKLEKKI